MRPHRFRDFEHLLRLGGIFAFGVLVFAIARAQFIPDDFGKLGHYRAGSVDEARLRPIVHAGQKACAECHVDVIELRADARHRALSCETCHGPMAKHAAGEDVKIVIPDVTPLCVRCHAAKTGKPARLPVVDIRDHAGDDKCVPCHQPHRPKLE